MEVQQFIDEHGDISTPRTSTLSLFFFCNNFKTLTKHKLVFFPMFNRRQDTGAYVLRASKVYPICSREAKAATLPPIASTSLAMHK
jgi:hypothetical protein